MQLEVSSNDPPELSGDVARGAILADVEAVGRSLKERQSKMRPRVAQKESLTPPRRPLHRATAHPTWVVDFHTT